MKILVINTGSSSIKYQLFDMNDNRAMATGIIEKIGESQSTMTHTVFSKTGDGLESIKDDIISNHREGMLKVVALLVHPEYGVIQDKSEIAAIGHRVVHGGEDCQSTTIIDEDVINSIRKNIPLAPLHNPPNLTGIEVAGAIFPEALQVAVFDTAFHQTIPEKAFLYALPCHLYIKEKVRRYGFHGTSHSYVAEKCADYLGKSLSELNLITIHLGNGCSMAAIKKGICIDTSMGMTPLEGLVMGTRSGDIDPAIPFFLAGHLKMSLEKIDTILNKESGLKGICGTNDMREVIDKKNRGENSAQLALDIYCYRIKKYIGAYLAALEYVDGLVFTAGIGENAPYIRYQSCAGLGGLGIEIDHEKNNKSLKGIREINPDKNEIKVMVIPTNEEFKIAQETKKVIETQGMTINT